MVGGVRLVGMTVLVRPLKIRARPIQVSPTAKILRGSTQLLVLVTGGTGFVGSHSIAALVRAGHRVRVLARSPERVSAALGPLGVGEVESASGDVTDPEAVEHALEGC